MMCRHRVINIYIFFKTGISYELRSSHSYTFILHFNCCGDAKMSDMKLNRKYHKDYLKISYFEDFLFQNHPT